MQSNIDLSIIIINYKSSHLILDCLNSFLKEDLLPVWEIIIVDNNSQDDSKKVLLSEYPNIKWVQLSYNAGFGRACNEGVLHANGKFILLLNPDTILSSHSIAKAIRSYKVHNVNGLYTVKVLRPDKSTQASAYTCFPSIKKYLQSNPIAIYFGRKKNVSCGKGYLKESGLAKWLSGAFILFTKELIENRALFDVDYFMYSEDVDLSYRLLDTDKRHYFDSSIEIIHADGATSSNKLWRQNQILLSELLFIRKRQGVIHYLLGVAFLKINFWFDSVLAKRKKIKLDEQRFAQNSMLNKFFFSVLLFSFRKKNHGYLKAT